MANKIKRIGFWLFVWAVLAGTLFYTEGKSNDPFFTPGMLWCGMASGIWGMLCLLWGKRGRCGVLTMAAMGCFAVAGVWTGVQGEMSWQGMGFGMALCLVMLAMNSSAGSVSYEGFGWCVTVLVAVEAVIGAGQWTGWLPRHLGHALTGSFDNPAGYAAYMATGFPFVMRALFTREGWKRVAGGCVAAAVMATVVLSGSRTGIAALLVVGMVEIAGRWEGWRRLPRWVWGAGVVVAVGVSVALYLWKKDSADGRLLIWRCSAAMIADAPVAGHGAGSFGAKYMDYQADFFREHPGEERTAWLADNVKHPFNEVLKIGVEWGVVGWAALTAFAVWLWRAWRRSGREKRPLFLAVAGCGVCGLFSYPLSYPGVLVLLAATLGMLGREERGWRLTGWGRGCVMAIGLALTVFTGHWWRQERAWHEASQTALAGETAKAFPEYGRLYPFMRENPLFLYNYGAELNHVKQWERSAEVLEECLRRLNDTDVQLLLADNYFHLQDWERAERHYRQAAWMCPNRFLPLYQLMNMYRQTGRKEKAQVLAKEIVEKPVKVPSPTVRKIQEEAQMVLGM